MAAQPNTPERVLEIFRSDLGRTDGDYFVHYYNKLTGSHLPDGCPWCACTVTTEKDRADVPEESILNYKGCSTAVDWFKKQGRFRSRESGYVPKPVDIIFYEWRPQDIGTAKDDGADHTGAVEFVSGGRVYTMEGNNGGMLRRDWWSLDNRYILGYGVPLYNMPKEDGDLTEKETRAVAEQVLKEQLNKAVAEELNKMDPMRYELEDVRFWHRDDIRELVEAGVILGDGVHAVAKRDSQIQVIVLAMRIMKLGEDPVYKTVDDVPSWARAAVQRRIDSGKLKGVQVLEDGTRILNIRQSMLRMMVMMDREADEKLLDAEAAGQEHVAAQE